MSDYYLSLTDDVVAELILWRLPVKSIMKCRCVCKSWYSLITNPNFISAHLKKTLTSTKNKNPQIFMHQNNDQDGTSYLLLFDNQHYFQSLLFPLVPLLPAWPMIVTVGSVNGLICISISRSNQVSLIVSFIVFNPSIGHFLSIPSPSSPYWDARPCWNVKCFGFDETTQDYIILLIVSNIACFIYSFNSRSWREITCPDPGNWEMRCGSTVFVNGRFHWLAFDYVIKFIMFFDIKTETFGRMSLPDCVAIDSSNIIVTFDEFGESSIAFVLLNFKYETHIWIMKEYGSMESWIKVLTLVNQSQMYSALGFRNKDELLIRYKSGCIASRKINNDQSQDEEEEEEVKNILDVDPHPKFSFSVHKYVPSLVLLNKKSDVYVAPPTHAKLVRSTASVRKKRIRRKATRTPIQSGLKLPRMSI